MDLKEQLAETDRLLSESTALLELQEMLVAKLREAGLIVKAAEDLKAAFALGRQTLMEHKQELEQALRNPMTGSGTAKLVPIFVRTVPPRTRPF